MVCSEPWRGGNMQHFLKPQMESWYAMDDRVNKELVMPYILMKHLEKIPSLFGGHLLSIHITPEQWGGYYTYSLSCRGSLGMNAFSWGRGTWGREPEGVFPNLRRMHEYWNLPLLCKQLSFYFLACFPFHKKNKLHRNMGMWEHKKLGEIPMA
jgi:hypothetical protein